MKQYFITIYTTAPKNKLQELLQHSFREIFEHKIIASENTHFIRSNYERTVGNYRASGGKAKVDGFSEYNTGNGIGIEIGDPLRITLTLVKGNVG